MRSTEAWPSLLLPLNTWTMMCQMVKLVREPHNPYDRWAVRVDNVLGEKVGHLSRQVAYAVRLCRFTR